MKHKSIIFILLCVVLCLIPSVGMLFFPTTRTSENRAMAEAPKLTAEDGSLNRAFFTDFESYFTEHMALRNELVYADAQIQSKVFRESNVSGVICGSDGWLYYSSTLDDYLGRNILSERELYCLANNFSVVQDYLQGQGVDFVLTIAPNKNTLYGEHMPYYQSAVVDARRLIVDGAVGMVEMALERLNEKGTVELDEERKAAMVSNMLVVLCGNRDAQPIVNSGSLY